LHKTKQKQTPNLLFFSVSLMSGHCQNRHKWSKIVPSWSTFCLVVYRRRMWYTETRVWKIFLLTEDSNFVNENTEINVYFYWNYKDWYYNTL